MTGKRIMKRRESGSELHTIENEKRPRVIKKRSGKTAFKAKYRRRWMQVLAMFSCFAILGVGVVAVGSIFTTADPNVVDPGFVTVSYVVPDDGSAPTDHSALENIGYMNRRFQEQTRWYSEMHGTTVANTMGINVNQSVNTYKQFENNTLIMADITTSSMVNKARQFCYFGDEVIWRMGTGSSNTWPTGAMGEDCFASLDSMKWEEDSPYGHMSITTFTEKNGLPGTGFCVYVINEETLLNADAVVDNGDGTYSQTYYLDPAIDKAPCHYVNQMVFTGDLPSLPTFNYITVTYTFDSTWQILKSEIDEQYTAVMGVSATCTSLYQTNFEYGTEKSSSTAYEDYFKSYIGEPFVEPDNKTEISSLNCLTSAFSSVLTGPVNFDLSLEIDGNPIKGNVYVNVGQLTLETMDIRAHIGGLNVWLSEGSAYVEYGGVKLKLTLDELMSFIGELTGTTGSGISLDTDALLGALADGEFTYSENSATLSSTLSLGLDIPVVFHFMIDSEGNISLGNVLANIAVGDMNIGAALAFGQEGLPALSQQEKDGFTDLVPLARDVLSVIRADVLGVQVRYEGEDFAVEGNLDVSVNDLKSLDLSVQGTIGITYQEIHKSVWVAYENDTLYLDLDGIKIKANVKEGIALITQYLGALPEIKMPALEPGGVLATIFSPEFANLIALENGANDVTVLLKGTQLLKAFNVDFALGDVKLALGGGQIGANALGADVRVFASKNALVAIDETSYADILPYVQPMISLFRSEALDISLGYEGYGVTLDGAVNLDLKELLAQGSVNVRYSDGTTAIEKALSFVYEYAQDGGVVYLAVDGLKVKAGVGEIVAVVGDILGKDLTSMPAVEKEYIFEIVKKIVAFDFGKLLSVQESDETLNVVVYGNELLALLGVQFDLGNVTLEIGKNGTINLSAFGADVQIAAGTCQAPVTEGYVDITPVLSAIPEILTAKSVGFSGSAVLKIENTSLVLTIRKGVIGFANGFEVYLEASIGVAGNTYDFILDVTKEDVAVVFDGLAARVRFAEFKDIVSAVSELYKQVASTVNALVQTGTENGVLAEDLELLMTKLGVADMLAKATESISFELSLLNEIVIGAPESENGICTLSIAGVKLELLGGTEESYLGATFAYESEKFSAAGDAALYAAGMEAMPERDYLGATDFVELLDYVRAALNTVTAENLSVTFHKGTVSTVETENGAKVEKTYDLGAKIEYYSGGSYPFIIDTEHKTVNVNVDLYAHVAFESLSKGKEDEGIFLDFTVLDYDQDDKLDFFITLSMFAKSHAKYDPLKLYATADELMNVFSTACAMLGINFDLLNDYLVSKWVDVDTAAQLRTLGSSLLKSFGMENIFSALAGGVAPAGEESGEQENFIRNILIGQTQFVLETTPFKVELFKTAHEGQSYLTGVGVLVGDMCIDVSLDALTPVSVPAVTLDDSYFKLEGIARLLKVMTTSATQADAESETGYKLDDHFYIDGKITLNMVLDLFGGINIKDVDVKLAVSVSVAQNGDVSANIRIAVPGVAVLSYVAINGDTVTDITLEKGMIYIKRVQSSYYDGSTEKKYPNPQESYRVMPLDNFFADILNQLAYALNFGSLITDNLPSGDDGNGETAPSEKVDIGTMFHSYIVSCVYTENADRTCDYTLTINGNSLLEGYLKNIVIRIGTEFTANGDEVIADLGIDTNLTVSVLKVDVAGTLRFENPRGIVVEEETIDVEDVVTAAMEKALYEAQQSNWQGSVCPNGYIGGQTTSVSFVLAGKTVLEKTVIFNTETKECYANLTSPDTSEYELRGYEIDWDFAPVTGDDGKFYIGSNQIIYGTYVPKTYHLTLVGNDGSVRELDYVYGNDILECINAKYAVGNRSALSCSLTVEDILNGEREAHVVWRDYDYTVTYYDAQGAVFATQYYKAGDALHYPTGAPVKVGHVLGGWKNAQGALVAAESAVVGDTALYPVWEVDMRKDVTVTFASGVAFEGSTQIGNYYYKSETFTDHYDISNKTFVIGGYLQLGWWYQDAETQQWTQVTSVEGLNGAQLWAIWVTAPKVSITNLTKNKFGFTGLSHTYSIAGTFTGGNAYDAMSKSIWDAVGFDKIEDSTTVRYFIYGNKKKNYDALKWGEWVEVKYADGVGTFGNNEMTSTDLGSAGREADYGGAFVRITYSYTRDGQKVTFGYLDDACMVSIDTYTVQFVDENGSVVKTVSDVRLDCPYDGIAYQGKGIYSETVNFDNTTYLKDIVPNGYVIVDANVNGDTGVTGNMTVVCRKA